MRQLERLWISGRLQYVAARTIFTGPSPEALQE